MDYPAELRRKVDALQKNVEALMNTIARERYFFTDEQLKNPLAAAIFPSLQSKYGQAGKILSKSIPDVESTMEKCASPVKNATPKQNAEYFYKHTSKFLRDKIRQINELIKAAHDRGRRAKPEQRRNDETREYFYRLLKTPSKIF